MSVKDLIIQWRCLRRVSSVAEAGKSSLVQLIVRSEWGLGLKVNKKYWNMSIIHKSANRNEFCLFDYKVWGMNKKNKLIKRYSV